MLLMVILPLVLSLRALRGVNAGAAAFALPLVLHTLPIDPDDVLFLAVVAATLAVIAWMGWTRLAPAALPALADRRPPLDRWADLSQGHLRPQTPAIRRRKSW